MKSSKQMSTVIYNLNKQVRIGIHAVLCVKLKVQDLHVSQRLPLAIFTDARWHLLHPPPLYLIRATLAQTGRNLTAFQIVAATLRPI